MPLTLQATEKRKASGWERSTSPRKATESRQRRITCIQDATSRFGATHGNPPLRLGIDGKNLSGPTKLNYQKRYKVSTPTVVPKFTGYDTLTEDGVRCGIGGTHFGFAPGGCGKNRLNPVFDAGQKFCLWIWVVPAFLNPQAPRAKRAKALCFWVSPPSDLP